MELESQAECKDVLTICKVHGRGKGHCKYFESEGEICDYYFSDIEHCGCAKAQNGAYTNKTASIEDWWHRR